MVYKIYPVVRMCEPLGVSKQAYYKHGDSVMESLARESFVVEYINEIRRLAPESDETE